MAEIKLVPRSEVDPSITWDMTLLYPSDEAFYAELDKLKKEMKAFKEKYENNEITKEALQDWKANYPDSLKKDYVPFEESNVKFYRKGITAKVPPDIIK